MVAIVSGNNLGLNLGSWGALGSQGRFGTATQGRNGESAFVDVSNGNLVLQDLDGLLVGVGASVASLRTYNSQGLANFTNNDGWRNGQYKSVVNVAGVLQRTDSDGSVSSYNWDATSQSYRQSFTAGSAQSSIKANTDGSYTWTNGSTGATERYAGTGSGLIQSSADANGNTLTFQYSGNLLTKVTDADGESVNYAYTGSNLVGLSTTLQSGQTLSEVSYTYDTQNRLTSVSVRLAPSTALPAGSESLTNYVTNYTYDGTSTRIASVTQSDGTSLSFTYTQIGTTYRVATASDGLGNTTHFAYNTTANTTTVTDAMGVSSLYSYDIKGQLTQVRGGITAANTTGITQVSYAYNSLGEVATLTDNAGHSVQMQYDAHGNLTSRVDAAGDTEIFSYNAANQVATHTIYATAAKTGAVAAAPETTRYVYAGTNPTLLRFVISPEGNVTEYRYNSNGLRTSSISYAAGHYSSTLSLTSTPTEAQMQSWTGTQSLILTQRSDFAYDFRGQIQTSTSYSSVDLSGLGVATGALTTRYVYDQHGALLQSIQPNAAATTSYTYDGLGRIVSVNGPSLDGTTPNVSLNSYDDANGRTTLKLANGLSTVSSYDHAGRLVSVVQSGASANLGTTLYSYDKDGHLLMTQDPTGLRHWMMYDAAGQKIADIDSAGALIEYVNNANGQVFETIAYATNVDTIKLVDPQGKPLTAWGSTVTLDSLRPAPSPQDEKSWSIYDDAHRLILQIDAQGYATETTYDGASNIASVTKLANPIDTANLGNGTDEVLKPVTIQPPSQIALSGDSNSIALGSPTLLTAKIDGNAPGGMVSFFDGQTLLGSAAVIDGIATLITSSLKVGLNSLQAIYSGDSNNAVSISEVFSKIVAVVPTNLSLSTSSSPADYGLPITLSATISAGSTPPAGSGALSGTVTFYNGNVVIGTSTVINGVATLAYSDLPVGSNNIVAVYSGDMTYISSTQQKTLEVRGIPTATTLKVGGAAATPTLTVTVSAQRGDAFPIGTVTFYNGDSIVGTAELINGQASIQLSSSVLASACHAVYHGDLTHSSSETPSQQVPSHVAVGVSAIGQGNFFTLTAQVTGANPTGEVAFFSGSTYLGKATLVNGKATLTVNGLPIGHTVSASYGGDNSNLGSISSIQIAGGSGTLTPPPTVTGPVTFVAEGASPAIGWPIQTYIYVTPSTGTYSVFDGETLIFSCKNPNGDEVFLPPLSMGAHNLTVIYTGGTGDLSDRIAIGTAHIVVGQTAVNTSVSSSVSQPLSGASVTLTANVSPAFLGFGKQSLAYAGPPLTGTVTFYNHGISIGTGTVVNGVASITTHELPVGTADITVRYSGDTSSQSSTSSSVILQVVASTQAASTHTVLTTSDANSNLNETLTLTASVASDSGQGSLPSGTVKFYNGDTLLGTANVVNGHASLILSTLPIGSLSLSAVYSGDTENATSVGQLQEVVAPAISTTTVSASTTSAAQGIFITLTAHVTGAAPGGEVAFFSGTTLLGRASLVNGQATLMVRGLPLGTNIISVGYSGDANNLSGVTASGPTIQIAGGAAVGGLPPVTSGFLQFLVETPPTQGWQVRIVAVNRDPGATGTYNIFDGQKLIASFTNPQGMDTYIPPLSAGAHTLTAVYSGDARIGVTVATLHTTVGPTATSTSISTSVTTALAGAPVTVTAKVQPIASVLGNADPSYSGPSPTGVVTFYNHGVAIGTGTIVNGVATLTTSALPLGTANITASYSGDASAQSSASTPSALPVLSSTHAAPTSIVLSSSDVTASFGQSVTLTASISSNPVQGSLPIGTVNFYNGDKLLGTANVVNGHAILTLSTLPIGHLSLNAVYSGDTGYATSIGQLQEVIAPAISTTTVSASTTSSAQGAAVTLTAHVVGVTPGGEVAFFSGTTLLGRAVLVNGQATLVVKGLPLGTNIISVGYSGDTNNLSGVTAGGPSIQIAGGTAVGGLPPVTSGLFPFSVAGGITPTVGWPILINAVNLASNPTGTFSIFDGQKLIASFTNPQGMAATYIPPLSAGIHTLTAVYSGDVHNGAIAATLHITVGAAPTNTTVSTSVATSMAGTPVVLTAKVQPQDLGLPFGNDATYVGPSFGGTVTFYNYGIAIGTGTVVNGVATFTTGILPVGPASISASYAGDASGKPSGTTESASVTIQVDPVQGNTKALLSVSSAQTAYGSTVTLTTAVSNLSGPPLPTGTVTFYNGTTVIGTATLVNGVATLSLSNLPVGIDRLSAIYSGDAHNPGVATATLSETIVVAPTSITLKSPASIGKNGPFSVQITGHTPTGEVSFFLGNTLLGTVPVDANGIATLSDINLPPGVHSFYATYSGDGKNASSLLQFSQTVTNVGQTIVKVGLEPDADRTTTEIYNRDGRLLATVDGEGYLTSYRYDNAGELVETVQYANPVPSFKTPSSFLGAVATARNNDSLNGLLPTTSSDDIHTYDFYNARGQHVGEVDGQGYLTETVYDSNGNVSQTIRYATPARTVSSTSTLDLVRPARIADDQVITQVWSAANQLTSRTAPDGTVTKFTYDSLGQVAQSTVAAGTTDQRTFTQRYDVQGRLTGELDGRGSALLTGNQTQAQIDAIWAQYGITHTYDAAGRRTSTLDANGNRTLFFYDTAGRLTDTVNALGEVTENRYNALGQLVDQVSYGSRISLTALTGTNAGGLVNTALTAALNAVRSDALDSHTLYVYNSTGTVASTKDARGNVTSFSYDAFREAIDSQQSGSAGYVLENQAVFDRRGFEIQDKLDVRGNVATTTSSVYDAFGRQTSTKDANGNTTTVSYDKLGRIVVTTDPTNAHSSTSYDAFGRVHTQTDALGAVTTYSYNTLTDTTVMTTPEKITVTTVTNREGQVQSITDGNGNTTHYNYDADGNLTSVQTPLTGTSSQFDAGSRLMQSTDGNGKIVHYTYDAANRLLSRIVDPGGLNLTTSYTYDAKGQQLSVTDPQGIVTKYTYDLKGEQLTQTLDPTGLNLRTVYTYDAAGQTLSVTSPGGTVTQYAYDNLGRRTTMRVDPTGLNLTTAYQYDAGGNLRARTDPDGHLTRFTYDADDRLVYTVDGAGDVQKTEYDADGRVAKTIGFAAAIDVDGSGKAWFDSAALDGLVRVQPDNDAVMYYVYDHDGRVTNTVNGVGDVVRYVYDGAGNVVERIGYFVNIDMTHVFDGPQNWTPGTVPDVMLDPARDEHVRTVYDGLNRAIYTINGIGAVTAQSYDGNGNVTDRVAYATTISTATVATKAALDAAVAHLPHSVSDSHTRAIYDAANRLTWSADGTGAVTHNEYDADGRLVRQTLFATPIAATALPSSASASSADRTSLLAYDSAGRLTYTVDALGGVTQRTYDANGNVIHSIAYSGRIAPPAASGAVPTSATISGSVKSSASDRVSRAVFDAVGREIYAIDSAGAVTQNTYDGNGNQIASIAFANPLSVATALLPDTLSAISIQSLLTLSAGHDRVTLAAFDRADRKAYSVDPLGYVTQTRYDGLGHIASTTLFANATAGLLPGATLNAIANAVTADGGDDQTNSFVYDSSGNLIQSIDALGYKESYGYDSFGNKIRFDHKGGSANTYVYDAAGHLITQTAQSPAPFDNGGDGNVTRMTYDALGNLISRTEASNSSIARTTSYVYDADGRQIQVIYPQVAVYNAAGDGVKTDNSASGAHGTRSEVLKTPSTRTVYDAFGDAVVNIDVAGSVSTKAYDKLGQVQYEVDALGYVTGYQRNNFGNVTGLTRYSQPTAANAAVTSTGANAPTVDQVLHALAPSTADRTISTDYDLLGRAVRVTQPTGWVNNGNGQSYQAAAVTTTTYDAFGQVTRTAALADQSSSTWANTTYYYDQRGQQIALIDALGYLTTQSFDAAGNVTQTTQFANPASGITLAGYIAPALSADNRTMLMRYDLGNRKISQTQRQVSYSPGSVASTTLGDLTTTYGYDAVGNLTRTTDALGGNTYTYYDGLGNIKAVAAPARVDAVTGKTFIPLTVFKRDALGNVVEKIEYSAGATSANEKSYSGAFVDGSGDEGPNDAITHTVYNRDGNVTEIDDAEHHAQYMSYDVAGHLVKSWRDVTGNDGQSHVLYTLFQYDALGRQTAIITPGSTGVVSGSGIVVEGQAQAGSVTAGMVWNSFGELTQRGNYVTGAAAQYQEHFEYDNAGRLWRTNSGDGVVKIALYNLQGQQTAQLISAGTTDLSTVANAQAADLLGNNGVQRTDNHLDLLGRMLTQTLAARKDSTDAASYRPVVYRTYDRWNNILSESDVRNSAYVTKYTYNYNNQLIKQVQPTVDGVTGAGPVTQIYYDQLGRQVAVLDARGYVNRQTWDAEGQLATEVHADGGVISHSYDGFGNQIEIVDARGYQTYYGYDFMGRNTSVTHPGVGIFHGNNGVAGSVGGTADLISHSQYDEAGRKIGEIDGNGAKTSYQYDLRGNVIVTTDADGFSTQANFDAQGRQTASQDANGALATWSYDAFGELTGHTDIGGAVYTFQYNAARELITQTNNRGQHLAYIYDAAGQLIETDDSGVNRQTYYSYNQAGKHVLEKTVQNGVVYQNQSLGYDALGQLRSITTSDGVTVSTQYDAVGNKLSQITTSGGQTQHLYYAYDNMNRQIMADGANNSNAQDLSNITSTQGHLLSYDANGNRTSDKSWGTEVIPEYVQNYDASGNLGAPQLTYASKSGIQTQWYDYDSMSRLIKVSTGAYQQVQTGVQSGTNTPIYSVVEAGEDKAITLDVRKYDGAGRVVQSGPADVLPPAYVAALSQGDPNAPGATATTTTYDAAGRVISQIVVNNADFSRNTLTYYQQFAPTLTPGPFDPPAVPGASGYDAAGNLLAYRVVRAFGGTFIIESHVLQQGKMEGYAESSEIVQDYNFSSGAITAGSTTMTYDANGSLSGTSQVVGPPVSSQTQTLHSDALGNILTNEQSSTVNGITVAQVTTHQLVVNGEVMGVYGPTVNGGKGNFDLAYQPVTNSYPAASTGAYPVRAGDTLKSIALSAYGDSSLWYLIADANGVSGDSDLRVGQMLNIPTKVGGVHNNSGTYAPYEPGRILGSTTPQVPMPAGGSGSHGCGGIGQIVMIVVAVVATVLTEGATAEGLSAVGTGTAGTEVGAIAGTAAGSTTFGTGLATLAGGYGTDMAITAGIVGSAAGSIASQAVGIAIGAQSDFSWDQVGLSAISGGISGGLSGLAAGPGPLGGPGIPATAARAAIASASTQGIAVAMGLQDSFSWGSVAASAAGAGVGTAVNQALGPQYLPLGQAGPPSPAVFEGLGTFGESLARGTASGFAGGLTTAVLRGGRIDVVQVATDAFGNALGDSIAAANGQSSNVPGPIGADERNTIMGYFADGPGSGSNAALDYIARTPPSMAQQYVDNFGGEATLTGRRSINPDSVKSLRQADGTYRTEIRGVADSPLTDAQTEALQRGYGPLTDQAARARLYDDSYVGGVLNDWAEASNAPWSKTINDALGGGTVAATVGAIGGVGASFGKMAYGALTVASDSFNQGLDFFTGGVFHDTALMQGSWAANTARGNAIVNAVSSPIQTTTGLMESIASRYNAAEATTENALSRSYQYGELFNDVGQGVLGVGAGVRSLARVGAGELQGLGAADWNFVATDVPTWGPYRTQAGAIGIGFERVGGPLRAEAINGSSRTVPLGFEGESQFLNAGGELDAALRASGINDATIGVRGSSVVGGSARKGTQFGPQSDIDFWVESATLTEGRPTSGAIEGMVNANRIMKAYPELKAWSERWTDALGGRKITPAGFQPGTVPLEPAIALRRR